MQDLITLAKAANQSLGRPSANAVWRWCRTGIKSLAGQRVRLKHIRAAQANELGHLFGSVGRKEIADALAKEGYNIAQDDVKLPELIQQLDKYTVTLGAATAAFRPA